MRSRQLALITFAAYGASAAGCTLIAGITGDYKLVETSGPGGNGGAGGSTSSSRSSSSNGGGGASSSSASNGGGGASSSSSTSSSSSSTGNGGGGASSSSSTGGGGASSSSSSSSAASSSSSSSSSSSGAVVCTPGMDYPCYTGPAGTQDVGICKGGMWTCNAQGDGYGPCQGQVLPKPEDCSTVVDDDCDGTALDDDSGCICFPGTTTSCYSGPGGTEGIGICKAGLATCAATGKSYGACVGEVLPQPENCMTPADDDCDGVAPPCLGGEVWFKKAGDATDQVVKGVAVQPDGTSYWTGYMNGTADFGLGGITSAGNTDVFVAKMNTSGTTLWAKKYGDAGAQEGRAIAVDMNGNVAITGAFGGVLDFGGGPLATAGSNDVFLAKLDALGNHIYSKNFGNNTNQYGNGVAFVPNTGEMVIVGYLGGTIDFGGGVLTSAGSSDTFIAKFSPTGAYQWSHIAGNSLAQIATAVTATPTDIVMTGYFAGQIDFGATSTLTTAGLNDIFLVDFDPSGNDIWAKRFGDGSDQFAYAIATDANGNIALTGSFAGVIDFGCGPMTSAGGNDAFLVSFASNGNCNWSKRFGDGAEQIGYGVSFDVDGNVIVVGSFAGSVNFTGNVLTSGGGFDVFVAKFDQGGNPLWSKRAGDASDQTAYCVGADSSKNVYLGGGFNGSIDFGGGSHNSGGLQDLFFVKLSP